MTYSRCIQNTPYGVLINMRIIPNSNHWSNFGWKKSVFINLKLLIKKTTYIYISKLYNNKREGPFSLQDDSITNELSARDLIGRRSDWSIVFIDYHDWKVFKLDQTLSLLLSKSALCVSTLGRCCSVSLAPALRLLCLVSTVCQWNSFKKYL